MKLYQLFSIVLMSCFAAQVYGQVAPDIGAVRYADGSVWRVYGVRENFLLRGEFAASTQGASFSNGGGLIAMNGSIRLIGPNGALFDQYDAGEANPILSITTDLTTAVAWLPSRGQFVRWNGRALVVSEPNRNAFDRRIISLQAVDASHVRVLIEAGRSDAVSEATISTDTGAVTSTGIVPGVRGPAIEHNSFIVFWDDGQLKARSTNGNIRSLGFAHEGVAFERAGTDWLHVTASDASDSWMLHVTGNAFELSQIPAPSLAGAAK